MAICKLLSLKLVFKNELDELCYLLTFKTGLSAFFVSKLIYFCS